MATIQNTMSYIARKPNCNCLVAAIVDDPVHNRDVARTVSRWLRAGLIVERVDSEVVRREFTRCPHELGQLDLPLGEVD